MPNRQRRQQHKKNPNKESYHHHTKSDTEEEEDEDETTSETEQLIIKKYLKNPNQNKKKNINMRNNNNTSDSLTSQTTASASISSNVNRSIPSFTSSVGTSSIPKNDNTITHNIFQNHPLLEFPSDRIRRAVWPVLLNRTADAHLTATARRKKKQMEAQQQQQQQKNSNSASAATATAAAASSVSSSSINNENTTVELSMTIEECKKRLKIIEERKHHHHQLHDTNSNDNDSSNSQAEKKKKNKKHDEENDNDEHYKKFHDLFPPRCAFNVVEADIGRSLFQFPEGALRDILRQILKRCVLRVCATDENIYYYQGFHDVATVLIHVYFDDRIAKFGAHGLHPASTSSGSSSCPATKLEERMTKTMLELTRARLRRFCEPTMGNTVKLLMAMHGVLQKVAPGVAKVLERHSIAPVWNFALSWLITWCSHDVSDNRIVLRTLFDFLVQTNENMIVFVCISVLVHFFRTENEFSSFDDDSGEQRQQQEESNDQEEESTTTTSTATTTTNPKTPSLSRLHSDFDQHRFGSLVSTCESIPEWSLHDLGILHTFLKKLPSQLVNAGGGSDDSIVIVQLHQVLETALRIEQSHKKLLLHLLENPEERVVMFPMSEVDHEEMMTMQHFGAVQQQQQGNQNTNNNNVSSTVAPPPVKNKNISSTSSSLKESLKGLLFFGTVVSAVAVQAFWEYQKSVSMAGAK